jgi:hypothetical protein
MNLMQSTIRNSASKKTKKAKNGAPVKGSLKEGIQLLRASSKSGANGALRSLL